MSDPQEPRLEPAKHATYAPPAITWEDELPQGAGLFAACGKVEGEGEPCHSYPAS